MFQITTEQRQFLTHILQDTASNSRIEVVPERGGIISQWSYQGRELLFLNRERWQDPHLSIRGGIPILFPICGNLPDDIFQYQGRAYTLKQHGFARDLPWMVAATDDRHQAAITLSLGATEETHQVYPFEFELRFTYALRGESLTLKQEIFNHSAEVMPFSLGFHPYFAVGDKTQLDFEIPAYGYQDQKTKGEAAFSGKFDFTLAELDYGFTSLSSQRAAFYDRDRGVKITLDYSQDYSTLVFWTLKDQDYVCLEPWTAPRNALNSGEKILAIAPHSSHQCHFTLTATLI